MIGGQNNSTAARHSAARPSVARQSALSADGSSVASKQAATTTNQPNSLLCECVVIECYVGSVIVSNMECVLE